MAFTPRGVGEGMACTYTPLALLSQGKEKDEGKVQRAAGAGVPRRR